MPDLWTHYFFAKEVMLENQLKELNTNVFFFGAQGPDFLFYLDFLPWKKPHESIEVGNILHSEKTDEILSFVFSELKKSDKILRSYLLGFLAHYALDSRAHPFVFFYAKDGVEHKKLEMMVDIKLYHQRRDGFIQKEDTLKLINVGRNLPDEVISFYERIYLEIFNRELKKEVLQKAYQDFKLYLRLTRANHPLKRSFLLMVDSLSKQPLDHYIYQNNIDENILSEQKYAEFMGAYNKAKGFYSELLKGKTESNTLNFEGRFID